jgi:hypothetical protein
MSAPSARDDVVAAPYTGKRLRKLRFLMTDNNVSGYGAFPTNLGTTKASLPLTRARLMSCAAVSSSSIT